MNQNLGKEYKICSKKNIDSLYSEGKLTKSFPLVWYTKQLVLENKVEFQCVFSVPKRLFKRAHDRNFIKRLFREIVRKHKEETVKSLGDSNSFFLIYTSKDLPTLENLTTAYLKLIAK